MALEKIGLKIGPNDFAFWSDVEITRSIDTFSAVGFNAPFEPDRQDFRITFQPFTFKTCELSVGGEKLFTGYIVPVDPQIEPNAKRVAVSAYGKPGVLEDCDPPASAYPLEFSGLTLLEIARQICEPFGLTALMSDDVEDVQPFVATKARIGPRGGRGKRGSKFARVALEPGDDAKGFLTTLAQQRGLVIRDTPDGDLIFVDSANATGPVANFTYGEAPLVSVKPSFKPQTYYSEITAFTPPRKGKDGWRFTVKNPFLTDVVRPHSFKVTDADGPDGAAAAVAKLGRMFASMVSWELELPTWRTPDGALWEPNTTITLLAKEAMIFRPTELLIRSVTLRQNGDAESATLEVVLPGAFDGIVPDRLPWSPDDEDEE